MLWPVANCSSGLNHKGCQPWEQGCPDACSDVEALGVVNPKGKVAPVRRPQESPTLRARCYNVRVRGRDAPTLLRKMNLCKDHPAPFPTNLLIYDCRTGEEHFKEIGEDTPLDMDALISEWVKEQFCGEAEVDFPLCDHGDYEASIKTDSNSPDSVVCWESCSFYTKSCLE